MINDILQKILKRCQIVLSVLRRRS